MRNVDINMVTVAVRKVRVVSGPVVHWSQDHITDVEWQTMLFRPNEALSLKRADSYLGDSVASRLLREVRDLNKKSLVGGVGIAPYFFRAISLYRSLPALLNGPEVKEPSLSLYGAHQPWQLRAREVLEVRHRCLVESGLCASAPSQPDSAALQPSDIYIEMVALHDYKRLVTQVERPLDRRHPSGSLVGATATRADGSHTCERRPIFILDRP